MNWIILTALSQEAEKAIANLDSNFNGLMTLLLIVGIVIVATLVLAVVSQIAYGSTTDEELDEEDECEEETPTEQIKKARKSAYQILAEEYARGKISDEEYTDRMARL